jgi:XFP C-terminal domain
VLHTLLGLRHDIIIMGEAAVMPLSEPLQARLGPPLARAFETADQNFDELFTTDKPVSFAFHGYPATLHKLIFTDRNAASGKSVAPRLRAPGARQGSKPSWWAAIERQFIAVSYGHATFLPAAWIWLSLWSGFAVSEDGPCASHGKINR